MCIESIPKDDVNDEVFSLFSNTNFGLKMAKQFAVCNIETCTQNIMQRK